MKNGQLGRLSQLAFLYLEILLDRGIGDHVSTNTSSHTKFKLKDYPRDEVAFLRKKPGFPRFVYINKDPVQWNSQLSSFTFLTIEQKKIEKLQNLSRKRLAMQPANFRLRLSREK